MEFKSSALNNFFLKLSLNVKLTLMMLFLSVVLISIYIFLYAQTEKALYEEFQKQTAELTKAIQVGVEEVTSSGLTDEKRLQNYLNKLNTKGVKELSIISNSDKIISSSNPKNVGKWISTKKKELIFKAELGEPVTGESHAYNVIIPVVAGEKHYGYIHLTINTDDFSSSMKKRLMQRLIAALIVLGIGSIFIVYLAGRYTKPIEEVVDAARMVAGGDLDQELKTERKDEIGQLTESFNFMVRKLREERELEERLRKAEHLAGIGQFSQSIAHEIRNPLNFISLSIDHIQEKYKPCNTDNGSTFDSLISNIKKEIQRVSKFAESFLEYSRPLELSLQKTQIRDMIEDILSLIMAKAQKEGIEIVKDLEVMPELMIDPEFMKTCLYNIVLNAFQAMPEGGTLTIRTRTSGGMFSIIVEDTGVGISGNYIGKIFDPFFTTKAKGLGLGLAITKRVIEEHKGRVELASTEGKGSMVMILLPMDKEV